MAARSQFLVWAVAAAALHLAACGADKAKASATADAGSAADSAATDAKAQQSETAGQTDTSAAAETATGPASLMGMGPLHCGHREVSIDYDLPAGFGKRTIPLHIWYPTTVTDGPHPTFIGIFKDATAVQDAALAPPLGNGGYPLLVHSHGYRGYAGNSAPVFCYLATHGYVTLAPDHIGNLLTDTPDPMPMSVWVERPLDIRQAVKWAQNPPAGDPLAGKLDLQHVAVSGHSYGTYNVWAAAGAQYDMAALQKRCKDEWPDCQPELLAAFATPMAEPLFKTAIAMAGDGSDVFGPQGKNAVKMPLLQMNGSLDDAGEAGLYDAVTAVDLTWVKVDGGCHQLFGLGNESVGGEPACAKLPSAEGFATIEPWILAWLRVKAFGETSGEAADIVSGKKVVSPRVTLKHKGK